MVGAIRQKDATETRNIPIPRPPNAWIIYRAWKAQGLKMMRKDGPPLAQAEVSREVARCWKAEPPQVKEYFEKQAEIKKAEHLKLYPDYRYRPRKREEKERDREEKRLQRERERQARSTRPRPASHALPSVAAPIPIPAVAYYPPEAYFGPHGPTPPMSAATSPFNSTPSPEAAVQPDGQSSSSSDASLPLTDDHTLSHTPSVLVDASSASSVSVPHPILFQLPPPAPPSASSHNLPTPVSTFTPSQTPLHGEVVLDPSSTWTSDSLDQDNIASSQDTLSFDIPVAPAQPEGWAPGNIDDPNSLENVLRAFLSSTGDPAIFQLNMDSNQLTSSPVGEIELEAGQVLPPLSSEYSFLNVDFDTMVHQSSIVVDPSQSIQGLTNDFSSTFNPDSFYSSNLLGNSDFDLNYNAEDYVNFDLSPPSVQQPHPPPPDPSQQSTMSGLQTESDPGVNSSSPSYVPPAGAAHSSTRRVAGSWKVPIISDDDLMNDYNPPRMGMYPPLTS